MNKKIAYYLTKYLTEYLSGERNLSTNTIQSYRDTFRLMLIYFQNVLKIKPEKIEIKDISKDNIVNFLNWLEEVRKISKSSRNVRLAAIHSFVKYLQVEIPENIFEFSKIISIKKKKHQDRGIPYLTINEVKLILNQIDETDKLGLRDKALLTLMYDTGARVDEIIHLTIEDIRLDKPETIKLHGKGNKVRIVPIMGNTVVLLKKYIAEYKILENKYIDINNLFFNRSNRPLTKMGITYIINKYVTEVNKNNNVIKIKVHPHTFRHSKAVHLLESNIELIYIRDFLGHSSVKTTEIYAKVCNKNKVEALEKAYSEITEIPNKSWADDGNLIAWLQNLCK